MNSEFEKVDLSSEPALGIHVCRECAKFGIYHAATDSFFAHCEHRLNGAHRASGGNWKVLRGIEAGNFKEVLIRACTIAALKVEVARDVVGIIQQQADDSTKH